MIDRAIFYREIRMSVFRGRLSRRQVAGMDHLLSVWARLYPRGDLRHLAYCFATAWHETAHTMQPVRETLAKSDRQAIARLRKWARTLPPKRRKIVLNYSAVHPSTGKAYFGRGYVQITWRRNYRRFGARLGIDLERHPELALRPDVAARILFVGMIEGLFTGYSLPAFINDERCDWVQARRVVNGMDQARLIAGVAEAFHAALTAASLMQRTGIDIAEAEREGMTGDPQRAENGAAVPAAPAPPPEVISGKPVPETGKPAWRSTTIIAALVSLLAQAAAGMAALPPVIRWGVLVMGVLAAAWIIAERIRHAWEDGI